MLDIYCVPIVYPRLVHIIVILLFACVIQNISEQDGTDIYNFFLFQKNLTDICELASIISLHI